MADLICMPYAGRHLQRGYWRASKRWCKQMCGDAANTALFRFANNGALATAAPLLKFQDITCIFTSNPVNSLLLFSHSCGPRW